MQAVADDIRTVGWSVSAVLGDEIAPPWAYTIGLWLSHQSPELAMFGLPVEHLTVILNSVGDRIASGEVFEAGDAVDGICPCTLAVRPVHASWRTTSLFAVSDRYYGYVRPPALQVVWPDRQGPFSGGPGLPGQVRGQAADAVAAPRGQPAGNLDQNRSVVLRERLLDEPSAVSREN